MLKTENFIFAFAVGWLACALVTGANKQVVYGQEKIEIAIAPIVVSSEVENEQKQVFDTFFKDYLSKYFDIKSASKYKQAALAIFDAVAAEQCTEGYCIYQIKKELRVSHLLTLEVNKKGTFYQIKLSTIGDVERTVEEDTCTNCESKELLSRMRLMLDKSKSTILWQSGRTNKMNFPQPTELSFGESVYQKRYYHLATIAGLMGASYLLYNDVTQYNNLTARNEALIILRQNAINQSELTIYRQEFESNQTIMKSLKAGLDTYRAIIGVALIAEIYLLVFTSDKTQGNNELFITSNPQERNIGLNLSYPPNITLSWKW